MWKPKGECDAISESDYLALPRRRRRHCQLRRDYLDGNGDKASLEDEARIDTRGARTSFNRLAGKGRRSSEKKLLQARTDRQTDGLNGGIGTRICCQHPRELASTGTDFGWIESDRIGSVQRIVWTIAR